jgi:hypothetical protein
MQRRRRLAHAITATVLAVSAAVAILELAVRAWRPDLPFTEAAHDVLFLTPDRDVGWKLPKDFAFFWNGRNPYCIEFRVQVSTNSFGFRDKPRARDKPPGAVRIAVLGDSFIEGIQVPLEQTATAQLEARLDERLPARAEVLNFGVSNYSIAQYLLVYDADVRAFAPDYVVVFASYLNFSRTTQRELSSRLQEFYALNVRPSFELTASGALTPIPAADYDVYARRVDALIAEQYGPDRAVDIPPFPTPLALPHWGLNLLSRKARPSPAPQHTGSTDFPDLDLNYRLLEELRARVQSDGGTLVFADAFEYLERYGVVRGSGALVARNRDFFRALGVEHVDLSPALRASTANPQFECDMHFSPAGHRVIADTLFEWFAARLGGSGSRQTGSLIMDATP